MQILDQAEKELGPSLDLRLARLSSWVSRGGAEAKAAIAELARTRTQLPPANQPAFLEPLARAAYRLGELPLARQSLRDLLGLQPDNLEVMMGLYDLALKANDPAEAGELVAQIRRAEGEEGTHWRFSQALYLITLARRGDTKGLQLAQTLVSEIVARRGDWWGVPGTLYLTPWANSGKPEIRKGRALRLLLRRQKITVERSRADHRQAKLDYEIALLADREFREGSMTEAIKDFERSVALAESDLVRCEDRLEWVRRMKIKGYVPAAQVTNEEFNHARALFDLGEEHAAYRLFTKWTAPRALKILEGNILAAEATLKYQRSRLNRNLERLATLEKQVELCTIRAPHDGFVIYANDERREIRIEEGMYVRQKQDLLYLPDLAQMEVVAALHESIMPEIAKGMRARVVVEGMPNRWLEGHVTDIAAIPTFNWRSDVRYFDGKVKLDNPPRGILPGMTAHVEIALNRRDHILAVPAEAITQEDGREICYVVDDDGLERREVKLWEGTQDFLEISEGLHEGEQVVLKPVLSEVEQDTNEATPLVSEATFSVEIADATAPATGPVRQVTALH